MTSVEIIRSGNLCAVAGPDRAATPASIKHVLEPVLTFTYKRFLRPGQKRLHDSLSGFHQKIEFEESRFFRYDENGWLVTAGGFLGRVDAALHKAGISSQTTILDSRRVRSSHDCYELDWDTLYELFQFRPHQEECILKIVTNDHGVISAPPGFGKDKIIAMLAVLYSRANIHVVVPGGDLVKQLVQTISHYMPSVGRLGCGPCQPGRIMVISADSLHNSDFDADILLGNEVHRLAAPTYSVELAKYQHSRNFGFSATPYARGDGTEAKIEALFGTTIFDLPFQEAVQSGLVVPIRVEWLDCWMDKNPCAGLARDDARKRHGIWRNQCRNDKIAAKAREYPDDSQVLILVETIEHGLHLNARLPNYTFVYAGADLTDDDLYQYSQRNLWEQGRLKLTPEEREQHRRAFAAGTLKKAIATARTWGTGGDFPELEVVIRADAQDSEASDGQFPGRVCRIGPPDKRVGILVDCLDQFDETFRRRGMSRKRRYVAYGWEQVFPS